MNTRGKRRRLRHKLKTPGRNEMYLFHYIRKSAPITMQRFGHLTISIARELKTTEAVDVFRSQDVEREWSYQYLFRMRMNGRFKIQKFIERKQWMKKRRYLNDFTSKKVSVPEIFLSELSRLLAIELPRCYSLILAKYRFNISPLR